MLTQSKKDSFRFLIFLIISTFINIAILFLIPGFNKKIQKEDIQYKHIKAGLVTLVKDNNSESTRGLKNKEEAIEPPKSTKKNDVKETDISEKIKENNVKNIQTFEKKSIKEEKIKEIKENIENNKIKKNPIKNIEKVVDKKILETSTQSDLKKSKATSDKASNQKLPKFIVPVREDSGIKGIVVTKDKNLNSSSKGNTKTSSSKVSVGADKEFKSVKSGYDDIVSNNKGINNTIPRGVSSDSDVSGGRVIWTKYRAPDYPDEAQKNGWVGDVTAEFLVKNGRAIFTGIIEKSGYTIIDKSVEKVAKNWNLYIEKSGNSVDGKVRVKIEFKL